MTPRDALPRRALASQAAQLCRPDAGVPAQVVGAVGWGGQKLPLPEPEDHPLRDLIARCWLEPAQRPSFSDICDILKPLSS